MRSSDDKLIVADGVPGVAKHLSVGSGNLVKRLTAKWVAKGDRGLQS